MTQIATVNYHVHKPERQAFELDAGGIAGNLISPELVPTQVTVFDERAVGVAATFADASVGFAEFSTSVASFETSDDWQKVHDRELIELLAAEVNAQEEIGRAHV